MVSSMTSRDRIYAALRREPVDRTPMMLWGLDPLQGTPDPSYAPLWRLIASRGDIKYKWSPEPDPCFQEYNAGQVDLTVETSTAPGTTITRTVLHTPLGDLERITQTVPHTIITATRKQFVQDVDDLRRWLSVPYIPWTPPVDSFFEAQHQVGEGGAITYRTNDPSSLVRHLFEPEAFALACREDPDLIEEATEIMAGRMLDHLRHILQAGARPIFIVNGPESAAPPMQSPAHFRQFVVPYARPLVELMHAYDCPAIIHFHGNLNALLEDLADLGFDGTHPVEEPPMGDVTLQAFKQRVGDGLTVVGGIQIGDMLSATPDEIEALTRRLLAEGGPRGLIVSPSATPYERPMSQRTFENYRRLIETVLETNA